MTGKIEIWHWGFLSPLVCPCIISCHCIDFCGSQAQKNTKNSNYAVFYSIKTDFLMSGRLDIWNVGFLPPLVCPCIISCHCIDFCGSQAQKGTKNCNFAVFYSIKTDFLMSGRLEIWNVRFLSPLVCPYKISCQCLDFCRSHAIKKSKKNHYLAIVYSITSLVDKQ